MKAACVEMGISELIVQQAIDLHVLAQGENYSDVCTLYLAAEHLKNTSGNQVIPLTLTLPSPSTLQSTKNPERVRVLAKENQKLKDRKLCRACRKVELAVTFLPCGHFITCGKCSEMLDDCPACGKHILVRVKTFLS